ncbi:MAG: ATP-binding cassette domain-containing protein, partial [Bacteroidia bacterium]|nr:ATP-binding cassette domain-containing protein [Bacteroidia bacterium]
MLGCFLFGGDDVFKKIKVLSGGEKARVSLAKTLVSEANFLLLDEPTNHLDIDSIEIIIEALRRYEGTLIFVSHNRYFIEKLANKVWWIEDQDVKEYPGSYTEYLYKVQHAQKQVSTQISQKQRTDKKENKTSKDSWKQKDQQKEVLKKLHKRLEQKEEQLANAQNHLKKLENKLSTLETQNQEDYINFSKEYADASTLVNQLSLESEKLMEEIIEIE